MGAQYYVYVDQQYGPYEFDVLKSLHTQGVLTADSWIFLEGETKDWTRAAEVASLKILFQPSKPLAESKLSERIKKASSAIASGSGGDFGGTMLVGGASTGVRIIPSVLPNAPLSDITEGSKTEIMRQQKGRFDWFTGLLARFRGGKK